MTKAKLAGIFATGLLLSNLLLIWYILRAPGHRPPEGPKRIIIEKLHFDQQQENRYEALIATHRQQVRSKEDEMFMLKNELYATLTSATTDSVKQALMAQIGKKQSELEGIHYQHFEDLRSICRPDQLAHFSKLTEEIAELFSHRPGKKHRP